MISLIDRTQYLIKSLLAGTATHKLRLSMVDWWDGEW